MWSTQQATLAILIVAVALPRPGQAVCPDGTIEAAGAPQNPDWGDGSENCVCPAGSYDFTQGFIFCFDRSKLYGGGTGLGDGADANPTAGDDLAFRVTYGTDYDLVDGWNSYDIDVPTSIANSTDPTFVACIDEAMSVHQIISREKAIAFCYWSRGAEDPIEETDCSNWNPFQEDCPAPPPPRGQMKTGGTNAMKIAPTPCPA
eukprot:COSAG05_NODE_1278_length_5301_cov_2.043253_1_plen_203_part_00